MSEPTIFDGIENPELFRRWFRDPTTWRAWFAFLRALFGLPLSEEERSSFEACTGMAEPPEGGVQEAWLICGRRSGKTFRTPVVVRPTSDGLIVPMPWGEGTDWYRNVRAAGGCVIRWKGKNYQMVQPEVLDAATAKAAFSPSQQAAMARFGIRLALRLRYQT